MQSVDQDGNQRAERTPGTPDRTSGGTAAAASKRHRLTAALAAALLIWLPSPGGAAAATAAEEARPSQPLPEIAVLEERSVLTPAGTLVLQPSLEFSHSTVNRVALEGFTLLPAITIGAIDVRRVDRNTLIAALALRYGLTPRIEVEIEVPYIRRDDSTTARPLDVGLTEDKITDLESSGWGDVEGRVRYQLNRGLDDWPFLVGDLRVKSRTGTGPFEIDLDPATGLQRDLPTGSGFWGIEPGLTAIFPSDPAVFFVRGSYLWTLARDTDFGRIAPGNAIGISLGMGFAINETASFSLGYDHSIVGATKRDGQTLPGSDTLHLGSLLLGASFRQAENRSLHLALAAGLTDDATDVRLILRYPISWALFP